MTYDYKEYARLIVDVKVPFRDWDDKPASFRDLAHDLLFRVVTDGCGFSGKRPWGNGGWEYDLINQWGMSGLLPGENFGDDEYVEFCTADGFEDHKLFAALVDEVVTLSD